MNEFDKWRRDYEIMTFEQQVDYHNDIERRYPEQKHYNYEAVKEALYLFGGLPFTVLEFGTWKGDLAKQVFDDFDVESWHGIEICEAAIAGTKCDKVKYIKPERFDWFAEERKVKADIIIATHFIEHLSNEHFEQLVNYCKGVQIIHFESPLTDEGEEWDGYIGTHKLTIGWNKINELMSKAGYDLVINQQYSKTWMLKQELFS